MANLLSTTVNGNLITSGGYTTSNYTRILYPSGGSYVTTTSVITGAIRIKLPTQGSSMMMTCTVKVYEYAANKSFTITFGGHRDGNNWYNEFCYLDGDSARGNLTVRFGVDGGKDCVWIGDTSTQWSHPQVFVTDVQLGYAGYNQTWASGWSVDFVTSFATINRTQTAYAKITNANIGSQSVNYANTAGSAPNGSNLNYYYDVYAGVGNGIRFWGGSDSYKISMGVGSLYEYGTVDDYSIKMQMNDSSTGRGFTWGRLSYAPIASLNSTSGDFQVAGFVKAPQFRLTNSTNNGYITGGNDWGIRFSNDNGWIQFGPANNSWAHIYSDKTFYFNQELYVNNVQVVKNSGTWGINITGSANSATTAGSAGVATYARRIAGPERTGFNVGGNASTFYPIAIFTGAGSTSEQYSEFIIERGGYEDPGFSGIGFSTFNARFTFKPSGWGYGANYFHLEQLTQTATMLGDYIDQYQSAQAIIWLRGATRYNIYSVCGSIDLLFANESGTSYSMAYGTYDPIDTPIEKATTNKYYEGSVRYSGSIHTGSNTVIHSGNIASQSVTYATTAGGVAWSNVSSKPTTISGYGITDAITTGNIGSQSVSYATTSGTFSTGRTNYKGTTDNAVAGQLMWKNYGNNHTIFDASNSTSPDGTVVNNTNSAVAWSGSYPTLMGWNGSTTYGVRVDSARVADSANNATTVSGLSAYSIVQESRGTHSGSDFPDGTLVTTDINASEWAGASFVMEVSGKSYDGGQSPFKLIMQGYLYADTIIAVSAMSYGSYFPAPVKVMNLDGNLAFWWPRGTYWNSFEVHVRDAGGDSWNRVTGIDNSVDPPSATKKVSCTPIQVIHTNNIASQSVNYANSAGTLSSGATVSTLNASAGTSFVAQGYNNNGGFAMNNASTNWGLMWNYASNDWRLGRGSQISQNGWNLRWDASDNVYTNGTLIANYFRNGSVWINNGSNYNSYNENIRLFDAPNGVSVIAFSASGTEGSPRTSLLGFSDRLETRVGDTWEQRIYSGYVEARGSFRAPIFIDSNDTNYYLNPNSYSQLSAVFANDWFRPQGNSGLYFQSYGRGIWAADSAGSSYGNVSIYGDGVNSWPGYAINSLACFMARDVRRGIFIPSADSWLIRYEQSSGMAFVDFELQWGSDIRYKSNIKRLTGALDTVKQLKGVSYNYKGNERTSIGFIAQEVEPVLPEVVSTDADGFKSVGYANIVALLSEAIKEQQVMIDELRAEIDALKSK